MLNKHCVARWTGCQLFGNCPPESSHYLIVTHFVLDCLLFCIYLQLCIEIKLQALGGVVRMHFIANEAQFLYHNLSILSWCILAHFISFLCT